MIRMDPSLCKRIERAETTAFRRGIALAKRVFVNEGFEFASIADGFACYAGLTSPISRATGLGLDGPASDEEIEALVRFYHDKGCTARIDTNPLTDRSVVESLVDCGFAIERYLNLLVADLTQVRGDCDPRVEVTRDREMWADYSCKGFFEGEVPDAHRLLAFFIASDPNVTALVLRDNDRACATGCLYIDDDGIASLFSTSTLPERRGRGYQTALIRDRFARATGSRATIARASAVPASASERNLRRAGFTVLYTRTTWVLPIHS